MEVVTGMWDFFAAGKIDDIPILPFFPDQVAAARVNHRKLGNS
jgi:hypothetical protein